MFMQCSAPAFTINSSGVRIRWPKPCWSEWMSTPTFGSCSMFVNFQLTLCSSASTSAACCCAASHLCWSSVATACCCAAAVSCEIYVGRGEGDWLTWIGCVFCVWFPFILVVRAPTSCVAGWFASICVMQPHLLNTTSGELYIVGIPNSHCMETDWDSLCCAVAVPVLMFHANPFQGTCYGWTCSYCPTNVLEACVRVQVSGYAVSQAYGLEILCLHGAEIWMCKTLQVLEYVRVLHLFSASIKLMKS